MTQSQLQTLVDSMQEALEKAEDARLDPDKEYPYAYGYLRGHYQHSITILQTLLTLPQ